MDSIWSWGKIYDPGDHSSRFLAFIIYFCLGVLNCGNLLWKHWLLLEMPRKNSKNGRLQAWPTLHRHHESSSGLPTFFDSGRQHEVFQDIIVAGSHHLFRTCHPDFQHFFNQLLLFGLKYATSRTPKALWQVDPPSEQMLPNERVGSTKHSKTYGDLMGIKYGWENSGDRLGEFPSVMGIIHGDFWDISHQM